MPESCRCFQFANGRAQIARIVYSNLYLNQLGALRADLDLLHRTPLDRDPIPASLAQI